MTLSDSFNPEKFIQQCKAHAVRCGYPNEAEDFAQYAFLLVWKYQHFQPMKWTWSGYLRGRFGNLTSECGRAKSLALRFENNGDHLLQDGEEKSFLDFIPSPEQEIEQKEGLTYGQEFFDLLKRAPSLNSLSKLRKTMHLRTTEFREMVEDLEPLRIDWIKL